MQNQKPILKLENIDKSFAGNKVLNGVSFELLPGEVHCLLGENGAGKSTLIKVITGVYKADNGKIIYDQAEIPNISPKWTREHGINAIYQEIDLVPHLSAAENISLGNEPLKRGGSIDWAAVRRKAADIFKKLEMEININLPAGSLKIAQQQMVAIAKSLTMNSKVLILDEPTAVFTSQEVDFLFRIIKDLQKQGIAILYISHHLDEIFKIGNRITILRDGCVVSGGSIEEFTEKSIINAMVGRNIEFTRQETKKEKGEVVLSVRNLSREGVVEEISLDLHRGEIVGIGGLVGAGRTEFVRLLIGADQKTSGQIILNGQDVSIKSPQKALKLGVGMVPESRKEYGVVAMRSMAENVSYCYLEKNAKHGFVNWKKVRETVGAMLNKLEVRPRNPHLNIKFLSGGNQQKIVVGKLLAADCDVIILDEPTRGVDVGARSEIYDLMHERKDKAILMVSSDMTELLTQSDRILVMSRKKLVAELDGDTATEAMVLSYAFNIGGGEQ